jgi:hydroxypyruvate reductase
MVKARRKSTLADIHAAGIAAASGFELICRNSKFADGVWRYDDGISSLKWEIPSDGRLIVVGAGKAAASLARGLEVVFGDRIDGGCVVVKYGHAEHLERIEIVEAAHPIPDEASVTATHRVIETVTGLSSRDRVIVALTGGASSLLVAPVAPLTLADKAMVSEVLIASGASIEEINTVRRRLSNVKGGRLLDSIGPAPSLTLAISDVPTRDIAMIGSGPSVRSDANDDTERSLAILGHYGVMHGLPAAVLEVLTATSDGRRSFTPESEPDHRYMILADSNSAIEGARAHAEALGYEVTVVDRALQGNTHLAARRFADALIGQVGLQPQILLAAGETTLKVSGNGRGGRNQEFALVAALALEGVPGVSLLASGTDGTDGPTDASGAFADGETVARARNADLDLAAALANNDSNTFFSALGDLHVTGPTGTNVMDLIIGMAR